MFSAFSALNVSAATTSNWTLAAEKFSYTQKQTASSSSESISKALPSLILEQISENLQRRPRSRELLDRELYKLQTERLSLFLQLSKEVQVRDSVFLKNYTDKQLKSKLKDADKKVSDISSKIRANLEEAENQKKKYAEGIAKDLQREKHIEEGGIIEEAKENTFAEIFEGFIPGKKKDEEAPVEKVVLYKNDMNKLFSADEKSSAAGYESNEFEKDCVSGGVNGLVTGKITVYGNYISVAVTLYQYPGGKVIGRAVDVGSQSELPELASSIAMQITPKISDSMPVVLKISVEPEEVHDSLVISIDDVVRSVKEDGIMMESGVHSIMFAGDGYETVSTSYNFSGNREFQVQVKMNLKKDGQVKLRFKNPYEGSLFANGKFTGSLSEESPYGTIIIDSHTVLGHFITNDGLPADFTVKKSLLTDGAMLVVKGKPYNKSSLIENRRKWMYGSYSVLICSLLPAFYCYGNSYGTALAYNNNYGVSYDDAKRWQTASNITMGISGACGVFFIVQLVRYLKAANSVLPVDAKIDKHPVTVKVPVAESENTLQENMPAEDSENTDTENIKKEE